MFTVVIAEKEHIDSIQEYQVFLRPFIDETRVAFCRWLPGEETLADTVPQLKDCVARRQEWRVIVLCDERGLHNQNPFDVVPFCPPPREDSGQEDEAPYLERLRQAKFEAFAQAARQPLTRLMTHLCQQPLVTGGRNNAASDPEFAEYLAESARKQELRRQIVGDETLDISLPQEIICVAKRTYTRREDDINTAWTPHEDIQYSRFYDWNLYFDKMRYLFFDILPKGHQNYESDYIRFLYSLLILANNDTPSGALRPNRVFRLSCDNDEEALGRLLSLYDAKLSKTSDMLTARIGEIQSQERERLSDRDAKQIFCANINVPVTFSQEIDRKGLYAKPEKLGLSTDCPTDERNAWDGSYLTSHRTLQQLLKQPRRALKSAVTDLRRLNQVDLNRAWSLNEFQAEDVAEYTSEEELRMVSTVTPDLCDIGRYQTAMADHCRNVHRKIETRMTRKTTVALGVTSLVLYLLGFLPLLSGNFSSPEHRLWALVLMGGGTVLLAAVALVCLFFLRDALRQLYHAFNRLMYGISLELDNSSAQFSQYLSHACNMMRGFSVLNFRAQSGDPDALRVRVLKKHMADIRRAREELRSVFGPYLCQCELDNPDAVDVYPYDFSRAVDFPYPMPYTPGMRCQIEFMQPGNSVQVPVDFVKRITVRREELYD
ncbi:hypothetical protein WMO64_09875 [Pseudoflavonifractor sp. CLA-AP-H29]|uniref:Uncharacterized protein n=1 Tax=Pseudoflavonifractor intestinihominis TaxID=3133171 RepID=A0ABV1EAN8_9FIRM